MFDADGDFEALKGVHSLLGRLEDVEQPLVDVHLEVLSANPFARTSRPAVAARTSERIGGSPRIPSPEPRGYLMILMTEPVPTSVPRLRQRHHLCGLRAFMYESDIKAETPHKLD
jgi:hypothetical protein